MSVIHSHFENGCEQIRQGCEWLKLCSEQLSAHIFYDSIKQKSSKE